MVGFRKLTYKYKIPRNYKRSTKMRAIFLGPPGVGKGTYSSRISMRLQVPHISTGDLFREEVKKESLLGKNVFTYMKNGDLVPDEITVKVLKDRINEPDCKNGFILDGFPRTIKQAEDLDNITKIDAVINLDMPDRFLIRKLVARRICKSCGDIYNVTGINEIYNGIHFIIPPMLPKHDMKCDKDGGDLIQRDDDQEDVINERLAVYKKQTRPLIEYYKEKGLIRDVFVTSGLDIMIPKILDVLNK